MSASSGSGSCGTHGRRSLGAARLGFDVSLWDRRRSTVHSTQIDIPRRVVRCRGHSAPDRVRTAPVHRPGHGEIVHEIDHPSGMSSRVMRNSEKSCPKTHCDQAYGP